MIEAAAATIDRIAKAIEAAPESTLSGLLALT